MKTEKKIIVSDLWMPSLNIQDFRSIFLHYLFLKHWHKDVASSEQSANSLSMLLLTLTKSEETHKRAPVDQTPARGSMASQEVLCRVLKDGEALHKYFTAFCTSEKHFTFRQSQVEFFIRPLSPWMNSDTLEKIITQAFHSVLLFSHVCELLCPPTELFWNN